MPPPPYLRTYNYWPAYLASYTYTRTPPVLESNLASVSLESKDLRLSKLNDNIITVIMRSGSVSSISSTSSRASSAPAEETMQIFVKNVAGDSKPHHPYTHTSTTLT